MKKINEMTIGELAAYISSYLDSNGIKCALTGGACVSIYTDNKYESNDLDFIDITDVSRKKIKEVLKKIGFSEKDRYFTHKQTKFFIEFPPGPVYLGEEPITKFKKIDFETGTLMLLTPTDSVKDRLAAYYHWDDKPALEQAKLLVKSCKVNLMEIERWSLKEGQSGKFKMIKQDLKKN